MKKLNELPNAVNTDERFWAAISERLDVIIDLLTPKAEVVESEIVVEEVNEEVVEEVEVIIPKKRRTKK